MPRVVPVALPAAMVAATLAWFAAVQAREATAPAAAEHPRRAGSGRSRCPGSHDHTGGRAAPPGASGLPGVRWGDLHGARQAVLRGLPQRARQGRRTVAGVASTSPGAAHARPHREDDPQAARRHDAAARRERPEGRRSPTLARRSRRGSTEAARQAERRAGAVPAAQSRRVRTRRQGSARARRRRHRAPAAGHDQPTASTTSPTSQAFSPTLMEGYLRAASKVTALAVGDPDAAAGEAHYRVPKTASQLQRVDGAPLGTRGGISVVHTFPADGDYVFRMDLHGNADGFLFGGPASGEQIEVSIDGERMALIDIDPRMAEVTTGLTLKTPPMHVPAGPQRVTAAFIQRLRRPGQRSDRADRSHARRHADRRGLRHHHAPAPQGPQHRRTAARDRRVGHGEPPEDLHVPADVARGRAACATEIVKRLADPGVPPARRRPRLRPADALLRRGAEERDFETGVAAALEAILASPQFLFRLECRRRVRGGTRRAATYRCDDARDLASRLSFFLWGTAPDAELLKAASAGPADARPACSSAQVKRMLADPRSEALSTRFASQWLRLNDVDEMLPDAILYPVLRPHARRRRSSARPSSSSTASCARIAACSIC